MNCDLCGKESDLKKVKIEGTLLSVCGKCSKFGEIVEEGRILPFPNPTKSFSNELFLERNVHERRFSNPTKLSNFQDREKVKKKGEFVDNIVSDYSVKIKESREKLRLTQKELGEKIAEKESIIHKIESGLMEPSLKLAKKLESFLKIKLIEIYEEDKIKKIDFKSDKLTIGDLLNMKKNPLGKRSRKDET